MGSACGCRRGPGAPPWATATATGVTAAVLSWAVLGAGSALGDGAGGHRAAGGAGLASAVGGAAGWPAAAVVILVAVLGVLLAAIDLACLRLPDPLVGVLAVVLVVPLCVVGSPGQLGRAVLSAGCLGVAYLILLILPGAGLGFGDVKLAMVLGFALGFAGWPAVLIGVVAPHMINGPVALFLLISRKAGRRTALPLGPALLAGALIAVAVT